MTHAATHTASFVVIGMTCGHCVAAVESEVGGLPGVVAVRADLATGRVEVESGAPVDRNAVAAAVADAGYTMVGQ